MRRTTLALLLASACARGDPLTESESPIVPVATGPLAATLIVSDPGAGPSSLLAAAAANSKAATVVYVSLPPGTLTVGASVRIANLRTSHTVIPVVTEGGFDPTAIPAVLGDTIAVAVTEPNGTTSNTQVVTVRARPPRVVRTNPPKGQMDVPLNLVIVIVVSEPIDPATLNANGVRLRLGAEAIAGSLELAANGTLILFTPASSLRPNTNYQLDITRNLTDRTAEPLEAAVTVQFTTGTGTVAPDPAVDLSGPWDFTVRAVGAADGLVESDTGSFMFSHSGAAVSGIAQSVDSYRYPNGASGSGGAGRVGGSITDGLVQGRSVSFSLNGWQYWGSLAAGSTDTLSGTTSSGLGAGTWLAVRGEPLGSMTLDPPSVHLLVARCRIGGVPQRQDGDECEAPRINLVMRTRSGARAFRPVTWTSGNASVAQVAILPPRFGQFFGEVASLTGLAPGSTTLTAFADGRSVAAAVEVATVGFASLSGNWYGLLCGISTTARAYCWPVAGPLAYAGTQPTLVEGTPPLAQVSQGSEDACGLAIQGEVYCWENIDSQSGRFNPRPAVRVPGNLVFASIAAGGYTACGLTEGGQAYCWSLLELRSDGGNGYTPVPVAGGQAFVWMTTGWGNSCASHDSGIAFCWGSNSSGQLGDGTLVDRPAPVPVAGGLGIMSITTSGEHTCALTFVGVAYCWGNNRSGQLGTGTWSAVPNPVPTAVSGGLRFETITAGHDGGAVQWTCGLAVGGAAYCWGFPGFIDNDIDIIESQIHATPTPIPGGLKFRAITAVAYGACGISVDGIVYCWSGFDKPVRVIGQP